MHSMDVCILYVSLSHSYINSGEIFKFPLKVYTVACQGMIDIMTALKVDTASSGSGPGCGRAHQISTICKGTTHNSNVFNKLLSLIPLELTNDYSSATSIHDEHRLDLFQQHLRVERATIRCTSPLVWLRT